MKRTRPIYWVFLPVLLAIAASSIWAVGHYGPIGKPSRSAIECADLRQFIISEEVPGKAKWNDYRDLVTQFSGLPATSANRIPLVKEMASTVIEVLGHDLAIYKEMDKFPRCVLQAKRSDLSAMISETESAINFLNGSEPINGTYFNPDLGTWNSNYYAEYTSAVEFLKDDKSKST